MQPAQDPPPAPTTPPPPAPSAPPAAAPYMPDVAAPPAQPAAASVELRVSKRILWIGAAVYPLHNIARVYTFVMRPKRKEAVLRFLRNTGIMLIVGFLAMLPGLFAGAGGGDSSGANGYVTFIWIAAFAAEIYFITELFSVLLAADHHVLAVETSGASTALVTSRTPQYLDQVVGQISYAIDHPDTEFKVTVESLHFSPKNYYFGDNVNMYGGSGNVGISG
ncbi:DUF6232 family protein [Streptomyces sp. NPDC048665]|uniref:DUF6232 family protein n=1 Tax=Streptomyces sp. NPDC048665 TaxID=3155490 RepID=UPI0034481B11